MEKFTLLAMIFFIPLDKPAESKAAKTVSVSMWGWCEGRRRFGRGGVGGVRGVGSVRVQGGGVRV